MLKTLSLHVTQVIGLLQRIVARGHGLKEQNRLKLVHAFLISRITYALPHLSLTDNDIRKVDGLIHKAFRAALQLAPYAYSAKLGETGAYNLTVELIEGHRTGQVNRMACSYADTILLERLRSGPAQGLALVCSIKSSNGNHILVRPAQKICTQHSTPKGGRIEPCH